MVNVVTLELEFHDEDLKEQWHTSYKVQKYVEYKTRLENAFQQKMNQISCRHHIVRNANAPKGYIPYQNCTKWYVHPRDACKKVRYPRLGAFEVTLRCPPNFADGMPDKLQVWSKLVTRKWPDVERLAGDVARLIEAAEQHDSEEVSNLVRRLREAATTPLPQVENPANHPKYAVHAARPPRHTGSNPPMFFGVSPRGGVPTPAEIRSPEFRHAQVRSGSAGASSSLGSSLPPRPNSAIASSPSRTQRPSSASRKRPQSAALASSSVSNHTWEAGRDEPTLQELFPDSREWCESAVASSQPPRPASMPSSGDSKAAADSCWQEGSQKGSAWCTACGHSFAPDAMFCGKCGRKREDKSSPEIEQAPAPAEEAAPAPSSTLLTKAQVDTEKVAPPPAAPSSTAASTPPQEVSPSAVQTASGSSSPAPPLEAVSPPAAPASAAAASAVVASSRAAVESTAAKQEPPRAPSPAPEVDDYDEFEDDFEESIPKNVPNTEKAAAEAEASRLKEAEKKQQLHIQQHKTEEDERRKQAEEAQRKEAEEKARKAAEESARRVEEQRRKREEEERLEASKKQLEEANRFNAEREAAIEAEKIAKQKQKDQDKQRAEAEELRRVAEEKKRAQAEKEKADAEKKIQEAKTKNEDEYGDDDFEDDDFEPDSPKAESPPALKPPDDARSAATRATPEIYDDDVEEDVYEDDEDFEDDPDEIQIEAPLKSAPKLVEPVTVGEVEYDYVEDNEFEDDASDLSRDVSIMEDNESIKTEDD